MRLSIATSLKVLLGLSLIASAVADPVPDPKRGGRGGSSGGDDEEEEDEGICTTDIVETRTVANVAITATVPSTIPCPTATSTSSANALSITSANIAAPTGAVDAKYLMGVGAGIGAAAMIAL